MKYAFRATQPLFAQTGLVALFLIGLCFAATAPGNSQEAGITQGPNISQEPGAAQQEEIETVPAEPTLTVDDLDLENTIYLDLEFGRVVIEMKPDMAPQHVTRVKELVREGFYDGIVFHRVIDGFMAQTGDPQGNGTGGSGQNIPAEFNDGVHVRGAVSMARAANINSADSQFFIVLDESPFLNGQYTYWGEVLSGMEYVDQIQKGDPNDNGTVVYPDRIILMRMAADVPEEERDPLGPPVF